jgi:hypothetical protein
MSGSRTPQGWPLFAVMVGDRRVFGVVAWEPLAQGASVSLPVLVSMDGGSGGGAAVPYEPRLMGSLMFFGSEDAARRVVTTDAD